MRRHQLPADMAQQLSAQFTQSTACVPSLITQYDGMQFKWVRLYLAKTPQDQHQLLLLTTDSESINTMRQHNVDMDTTLHITMLTVFVAVYRETGHFIIEITHDQKSINTSGYLNTTDVNAQICNALQEAFCSFAVSVDEMP